MDAIQRMREAMRPHFQKPNMNEDELEAAAIHLDDVLLAVESVGTYQDGLFIVTSED